MWKISLFLGVLIVAAAYAAPQAQQAPEKYEPVITFFRVGIYFHQCLV